MTQLAESLVHVFHDGIIVTHEEKIVYSNKQTKQLVKPKETLVETLEGLLPLDGGENLWQ